ncbi:hypothetical protein OG978_47275 (plasmid) [Streptomyces sp. NBC_01591]|uniref:hypothetical protein n=1 Tax=Streptomyces sp. NBC_01591 TaxID=2975888 RepID=UPI002DDC00F2|nr:hypothetical protein [Streptomyces sp. NBC_01591]WSD66025.1 hypothetical protein OG978_00145 [Streptomyces sp. NBC_01591]WSD73094.1 hypothetical protein OG978_40680 [Streptomyces sp. NBC_01591]WSD73633.1 hypothetical protein OG978_40965 [Streptomyces sp. NBC_01591]WSD74580.1 hypothetical protein OG978_47275 [Streptomyces sp. NBC_01591]
MQGDTTAHPRPPRAPTQDQWASAPHRGFCEVAGIGGGPALLTDWMAARRMDVVILSEDGPDW